MSQIRIVTDSTCDLPAELAQRWNISVAPCYINFGTQSFLDKVELTRDAFYQRLAAKAEHPTTAAPPAGHFAQTYRSVLKEATGLVSIHPPDHFTALRQSAINGWDLVESTIPYLALDAGQLSIGLGWIVVRAAQAAAAGESMEQIRDLVADLRERVHLFAALQTVKYLLRSGRVGWARGAVGQLLRIRPLLHVYKGEIKSLGYVRTHGKAVAKLLSHFRELGPLEHFSLLHSNAPQLAEQFQQRLPSMDLGEILTINVTPILGTHVGPDAFGFVAVQSTRP